MVPGLHYTPQPHEVAGIAQLEEQAVEAMAQLLNYPHDSNDLERLVYAAMKRAE